MASESHLHTAYIFAGDILCGDCHFRMQTEKTLTGAMATCANESCLYYGRQYQAGMPHLTRDLFPHVPLYRVSAAVDGEQADALYAQGGCA